MKQEKFKKKFNNRLNQQIRSREVRVVQSGDEFDGIRKVEEALGLAREKGLDLVEINPKANPPICRIMEFSKFKYEQKKKEKVQNKNKTQLKEVKFSPNIGDHDFEFKMKNAEKFLQKGDKVKAYIQFRGRENIFRDRGELVLLNLAEKLNDSVKVEQLPKMQGKQMIMLLSPKK